MPLEEHLATFDFIVPDDTVALSKMESDRDDALHDVPVLTDPTNVGRPTRPRDIG